MEDSKRSFVAFYNWEACTEDLTDEQLGQLWRAIYDYEVRGVIYSGADMMVKMAWKFIKGDLDISKEKYSEICKKRSEAGKRGGAPKGNQNAARKNNQKQAKTTKSSKTTKTSYNEDEDEDEYEDGDGDEDEDEDEGVSLKGGEGGFAPTPAPEKEPPSLEEVRRYAAEHGMRTSPDRFWEYYSASGWMAGRAYIGGCWQEKLEEWDRTEYGGGERGTRQAAEAAREAQAEDLMWLQTYMKNREGET